MIFFTSDLHLGNERMIRKAKRPFNSVEEMDEYIIGNINKTVGQIDTLYILGDISSFTFERSLVDSYIKRINGKKILLIGNNDREFGEELFDHIYDFKECYIENFQFVLMHYPLMQWPGTKKGSIHLHGHIHSNGEYNKKNIEDGILRFDVGVDSNDFKPYSLEDIIRMAEDAGLYSGKYFIKKGYNQH